MPKGYNSNRVFQQTDQAYAPRSVFDLSYRKLLSCDFGDLIPIFAEEAVPGDIFKINTQLLIRMQPLVAPIMHEVNAFVHFFFCPYRKLWPKPDYENNPPELESGSFETFITGGIDGQDASTQPVWAAATYTEGSLWDYFGFPTGVAIPSGSQPTAYQKRAYNWIWNEYYRDENLTSPVDLDDSAVKRRAWEKDYFTSGLLTQQRGIAPALPVTISGTSFANFSTDFGYDAVYRASGTNYGLDLSNSGGLALTSASSPDPSSGKIRTTVLASDLDNNVVAGSSFTASTFDVADLRLAFQIQRFMERNNRAGVRYVEFLGSHFGVHPRDERLQRPEYIGGMRTPVIVSEVLQTSESATTAQGNMAGHGISVDNSFIGKYRVEEFGVIIGILSIMPRSMYQQGIDRQWLRQTRYDYYFPEFANLSEQGIENMEIFVGTNNTTNHQIWGYQGRYDEMRVKRSMVTSEFRNTFDYWHLGRKFSSLPPLDSDFVELTTNELTADTLKRVFADTADDGFLVSVGNIVTAIRPLPAIPIPGMIDHG